MNAFFKAQYNYCPVVWMFHSCSLNNKINRLLERYLRIIWNNKHYNFEELLNKDNSVSINYNHIHVLANDISPEIMTKVFNLRDTPSHISQFSTDPIHTVYNWTESKKIWKLFAEAKNKESLDGFKRGIKK